ncbi:hypothetical protein PV327_001761 [Microctonus hyperodae]|uniref:Uncharacterized protein n=1 Tax=Microctonus hyperodae TaxID=165561 RepID=A0AA39KNL7_MICHY|nr:hypothetical protein PV327_001761 [Microctonus hyperodae]
MLCQGLRRANIESWIAVFNLLNTTDLYPSARLAISRGLACTENHDILENYVYYILADTIMFPSENIFPILLTAARLNEINSQIVLHFIIKNHELLTDRLGVPREFHKQMLALSQDIFISKLHREGSNSQGSPLTYTELPKNVRRILEANTHRANKIRPAMEDYFKSYQ